MTLAASLTCCFALTGAVFTAAPAVAAAPTTRVVVTSSAGTTDAATAVTRAGGRVLDRLDLVGGVAAVLPQGAALASSYVVAADRPLALSGAVTAASDEMTATVRETLGLGRANGQGRGVTVAVVDTGVAEVPDLAGRVTHVDVSGAGRTRGLRDGYGHGTFVAGLVAGSGADSDGLYAGVAPSASILDVRVADADGTTSLLTVLRGLQVVASHHVDVVNLSLSSGSALPYQLDPLTVALDELWRRGTVVVVPAGNEGPDASTITSPGVDPTLLTAGGLDAHGTTDTSDDSVASWSGQGPAPQEVAKPDLVAPGAHVVSLRAPGSVVDRANPTSPFGDSYLAGSGTSFATAITSGAAALLLDRRGSLSPDQVKAVLTGTAYEADALTSPTAAGAGGLDVLAALRDVASRTGLWRSVQSSDDNTNTAPAGDVRDWRNLLLALNAGDARAAASSWSRLSPAARSWAANSWSALSADARDWAISAWGQNWDSGDGLDWAARNWAARTWSARNWSANSWSDDDWSARNWSEDMWNARNWSDDGWAARNWSARNWSARNWSARNWSARNWSNDDWSARNWSARNWSADSWSAEDWG